MHLSVVVFGLQNPRSRDLYVADRLMDDSKNRGGFPPKMDGLFHGKACFLMDDLGVPF